LSQLLSAFCPEVEIYGTKIPIDTTKAFSITTIPAATLNLNEEFRGVLATKTEDLIYLIGNDGEENLRKV